MVKDIKYIIKRILISVGIFLVLSFLRGNLLLGVHALGVDGQSIGPHVWSVNNTTYWVNASANNLWYNWQPGYIEFSFSINKMNKDSVSPLVTPKNVVLSTSAKDFTCNIGSTSANNSTYVTQVYSVSCPVSLDNAGVTLVTINLMPLVDTPYETYEIYFNGLLSYVDPSSSFTSNVNVDTSGIINSQNQNSQSVINNQNQNTQSIINNQNQNTQSIINSQENINNSINDSSTDAPNNDINNMNGKVASNNSITQLLTLPITLFQNVLNNINGSCSSYNLGALYGSSLTLPCINLESILGSTLWGVIDVLISGLFILSFRKKMVDIFNHMSSLNDRGNELE